METFIEPKEMMTNPGFQKQKQKNLLKLTDNMIDPPIIKLIHSFNKLHYCFTLQCCYGHFVYGGRGPHNIDPLSVIKVIDKVEYRIAYLAFCIENSKPGREFIETLREIPAVDPENIQLCSAEWFWKRQVNSYA
ncbi:MAG: hypothetical protein KAR38_13155, partial [Calditrichia bacterium]|nr:hypothetical protein [Calditrichia bacterium]